LIDVSSSSLSLSFTATIVSLKIRSTDPIIGDSYQHFVNQDVVVLEGGQRPSKDKLNVGEQFVRARSNSSPESKVKLLLILLA